MRALAFVTVLFLALPASAEGISWSVGLGAGGSSLSKAVLANSAGALSGRLAYGLTDQLEVGGELFLMGQYNGWKVNEPVTATLSSLMAQVTFHDGQPWYAVGGLGWGSALGVYRAKDVQTLNGPVSNIETLSGNGISGMLAAGWTFKPGPVVNVELRYDVATLFGKLEGTANTVMVMGRIGM